MILKKQTEYCSTVNKTRTAQWREFQLVISKKLRVKRSRGLELVITLGGSLLWVGIISSRLLL